MRKKSEHPIEESHKEFIPFSSKKTRASSKNQNEKDLFQHYKERQKQLFQSYSKNFAKRVEKGFSLLMKEFPK